MLMKLRMLAAVGLLGIGLPAAAQSYTGLRFDNYAGVQGLTFNPAGVVNPHLRGEINLASASAFLGNDYVSIGLGDVIEGSEDFDFLNGEFTTARNDNYFATNVDVLGPSFLVSTGKHSGVALLTRVRTMVNVENVNGQLFQEVEDSFAGEEDFDFNFENQRVTGHGWGEIALVYGRDVASWDGGAIRAAATLKYLKGAGGGHISGNRLVGSYQAEAETLTADGDITYGYTTGFDDDGFSTESLGSGFGFDLGVQYEWQPTGLATTRKRYHLRVGASVTDIGSITYEDARISQYQLTGTADVSNYGEQGLENFLIDNYSGVSGTEERSYRLPTAFRLMADVAFTRNLYVTLATTQSLSGNNALATSERNTVVVAPRFESKWLSLYSPFTLGGGESLRWGAGLRFGPLTIGSGSALSALLRDRTQSVDVYAGLKIPIYRKGKPKVVKPGTEEEGEEKEDQSSSDTEARKARSRR